jgi:hypothetical protein
MFQFGVIKLRPLIAVILVVLLVMSGVQPILWSGYLVPLNVLQIDIAACKGALNECGIFMGTTTVTNDFTIEKVNQHTNVMSTVSYSDIR